jgi:hypothetical protein
MNDSIHNHSAPPFLMSPGDKLFPPPGSFNFSMAALAADPQALASECKYGLPSSIAQNFLTLFFPADFNSMQNAAAELAGSPQGKTKQSILLINPFVLFLEYSI